MMEFQIFFPTVHDFLVAYFHLVRFYSAEAFKNEVLAPALLKGGFECLKVPKDRILKASTALADAVADYDSIRFNNSILAAAAFHWACSDGKS